MGPADLKEILKALPTQENGFLLTSWDKGEDAATWMIDGKRTAIMTVDFITPVVDDPFTYGQIAAANALSDVYAMGGRPLVALNIVGFPVTCEPLEVLSEILKGGQERVNAAGAVLAGGHSVDDGEPKYGLAVFGEVDAAKMWKVTGARPGDALILTKPLGTGLVATAIKAGAADPWETEAAVRSMGALNDLPARLPGELLAEIRACTDVTGFSLAGHLLDMLSEGGLEARLAPGELPLLPGALEKAEMGFIPGGSNRNMELYAPRVEGLEKMPGALPALLFDAQTSGGLLLAVSEEAAMRFLEACHEAGFPHAAKIGVFAEGAERIRIW